ncbi:sigma-54 dependent transcriptional regulator [Solimonas sp. SE-A11]|uniref:sigma-54-dependent transcriptional regulator n=1 Tax=Solimonas sp. SE-A11 TaxID=3054954 RepID=UPI00259CC251|nr:sigma-54 dependent transcriptional regulator [Solimonas sp. SE-A11]MDM4770470.1 sigma-54 dependent transcriptional regulator [Solimonas sp. SE-A11]
MSDRQDLRQAGVLLVDDDPAMLRNFRRALDEYGYRIETAQSPAEAESALARAVFDVCLLDVNLGEDSGMDLLPRLREAAPWMRVVMATALNDATLAVSALRTGASDYLVKPCTPDELVHAVAQQADARRLEKRIEALEKTASDGRSEIDLETRNPQLLATYEVARQVAATDATVLILGESGVGKNVLARAIHDWSARSKNNFATVSCPSLSAELLASELFGHVRGAFTGATDNRQGRVQVADGGTLFLDEIGDMPAAMQPKLLRFIQDREYERVGDPNTRKADVRVIAATNHDLRAMAADGRFREDLYYRLNVVTLTMPSLRERREDIARLATRLLEKFVRQYDRPARRFGEAATALLVAYDWPGNLRELRNVVERAVILCQGEAVGPEHLPFSSNARGLGGGLRVGDPVSLQELEHAHIQALLAISPTMEAAARTLGIDSSTLYRKRKQYNMP